MITLTNKNSTTDLIKMRYRRRNFAFNGKKTSLVLVQLFIKITLQFATSVLQNNLRSLLVVLPAKVCEFAICHVAQHGNANGRRIQ